MARKDGSDAAGGDGPADVFRTIFDNASVGIFHSTPAGRLLRANAALARIMGYDSAERLIADTTDAGRQHYVNPQRRLALRHALERDGRVEGFLAEARRRDGSTLWVSMSAVALRDRVGQVQSYIGTTVDVTDLVRAQEALARASKDFRRIFDNAAEGMYQSTPEGRQLRANPALVRLNGYASEAEMLAAVNDIATEWYVDPNRRAEFKRLLERDGRVNGFESEVYRHRTRERIWISENAWIVRDEDGRPLFYEGTVIDITQRKRMGLALTDSERRFRDFAEVSSDWYWETDAEHRYTYLSEQPGIDVRERLGKTRWEVAVDPDEEAEKWRKFRALLDRHEPFRDFVYRSRTDDGRVKHNAVSGKPMFDAAGRFLGYRGTARNVTAIVQAEERLRRAMQEAEEANRAKVAFLANMSHELRTPLNAILGFAEVIRDQLYGADDRRYAEYARFICESGGHLLTIINDILDMAKMDAGQLQLFESEFDLGALIQRQCDLMVRRAQDSGVTVTAEVAPDLPALRADEVRVRQIVLNLLSNAVKFTPAGGTVTVSAGVRPDGRMAITVADTGIGMTEDEVAVAMQPFRQVEADLARRYDGTGLGLPITKSLAALHGAELSIASEKGRGTAVTVLMPAARVVRVHAPQS
jgi:PAS domain S-box-containing protein